MQIHTRVGISLDGIIATPEGWFFNSRVNAYSRTARSNWPAHPREQIRQIQDERGKS
jgi:hypothetical protein